MKGGLKASLSLALVSMTISFGAAEMVYRAVLQARHRTQVAAFRSDFWQIVPDSPLVFRLPTNHVGRIGMAGGREYWWFRTNADGFRDLPRGKRRQAVPRVLVLGDSYTFGWGLAEGEPYSQRAEALLRENRIEVEVINAGVPGYNTEQESFLLDELLPRYQPDMVVVGYVMNDAEPQLNAPQPPSQTYRYARSWMWEDAREILMRRLGGLPTWSSPNKSVPAADYALGFRKRSRKWRESKAALARVALGCRRSGVPALVLILPAFTQPFDGSYPDAVIHRAVTKWGGELGIETVDLMPLFQGQDHRLFMIPDDGHPNARAHEVVAGVLRDRIVADLHLAPPAAAAALSGTAPTSRSDLR